MKQRLEMLILGRVQGVGFRSFIFDTANKLTLKGVVRNLPEGGVEVIAEGDPKKLIELIKIIENKNGFIRVDEIKKSFWPTTNEFIDFKITG